MIPVPATARNRVLATLFAGMMMAALDIAIIGPALPAMTAEFAISARTAAWIYAVYILCFLIGTPVMAKLSDLRGRRFVFAADVALFGAGSLLLAAAPSITLLLLGRAVQGLAAGGIVPAATAIVGDMFPVEKRGTALGILQAVFGIAMVAGPVIGGFLLMLNWRFLFLINIPVAALVCRAALRLLPGGSPREREPFDWPGALLLAALLSALSLGVNRIDTTRFLSSAASAGVLPFLLTAAALLPLFIARELHAAAPVLPVRLYCSRKVLLTSIMSAGTGLCLAGTVFMPAMAVSGMGLSQYAASFIMIPLVVSLSVFSIVAGKLLERVSARSEMVSGAVLTCAGMFLIAAFTESAAGFVAASTVFAAGIAFMPMRFVMLSAVPSADRTASQGLLSMTMSMGQMVGGVLMGGMIASYAGTPRGYVLSFAALGLASVAMVAVSFLFKGGRTTDVEALVCD